MNNLEQTNRLADFYPQPIDLQSHRSHQQLQTDERQTISRLRTGSLIGEQSPSDCPEKFVLPVQSTLPRTRFGLLDSLSGHLTISCFIPREYPQIKPPGLEDSSYKKNGILVHRAGRVIASKDVEDALADE